MNSKLFSSVQFSTAQLNWVSVAFRPWSNIKSRPIILNKFRPTPETVVSRKGGTRPGNMEAPVAGRRMCAWMPVGGRARRQHLGPFNIVQVCVISQVRRCLHGQRREDKACQFKVDASLDLKSMQLTQNWRDLFPSCIAKPTGDILHATYARFYRAMHFSANARSWDRMSSVRLSVCPSVCNVGDLWSHRLEILGTNCMNN